MCAGVSEAFVLEATLSKIRDSSDSVAFTSFGMAADEVLTKVVHDPELETERNVQLKSKGSRRGKFSHSPTRQRHMSSSMSDGSCALLSDLVGKPGFPNETVPLLVGDGVSTRRNTAVSGESQSVDNDGHAVRFGSLDTDVHSARGDEAGLGFCTSLVCAAAGRN